ncbi:MAG: PKD domain-containing protein [Bacteroidetes bacterium]|nr:MAG: PKD domain-containing protein [Bacteroidota bacterium]
MHTYAAAGNYTVTLKATNSDGESATRSTDISIVDPDQTLALLAGTDSKIWYLQREGVALGVGPEPNDNQWWALGNQAQLGSRPCVLDDQYIFHRDGSFEFNSNNTIFIDSEGNGGWLAGAAEGCHDESEPGVFTAKTGEDVSAFGNGGDYTYDFDGNANTLTLNGLGAYIGLSIKTENGDSYIPVSTKTYTVLKLVEGAVADSLQIALDGDGFAWNFYLVSYKNPADLPDIPSTKPVAAFDYVRDDYQVTFSNKSTNATSYTWDFGDGNISSDASPVHTYASTDGSYLVTLTAMDAMGQSSTATATITISSAAFTAATMSSAGGKTWRLAGGGSIKVGPAPGNGEWFTISDAQAMGRPCMMNDEFTFFDDGTMKFDAKGDIFFETFLGGSGAADMCQDASVLTAPYDALVSTDHTFSVDAGSDPATITAIGTGAFIGYWKAINGGELNVATGIGPADQITYEVLDYSKVGDDETLVLTIDISGGQVGGAYWTITITTAQ